MRGWFQPYTMTLKPGRNPDKAAAGATKYIVEAWLPGNAGGALLMVGPRLMDVLLQLYERAALERRPIKIRVESRGNRPYISEEL